MENREFIFNKYGGRCAYCGCELSISKFHVDHVIPQFQGRSGRVQINLSHIDNLNPSCISCNIYKRANSLELFRSEIEEQVNRLRKHKPTFRLAERFGLIECKPTKITFYFEKYGKQE